MGERTATCGQCGQSFEPHRPSHQQRFCSRACYAANIRAGEKERFLAFVMPEPNTGCWLWTGAINQKGYGRFGNELAHRASFRLHGKTLSPGHEIDHRCRQRSCVNPDHLDAVTHRENLLRGNTIVAREAATTHCPKGHPLSDDNLRIDRGGHRICRECERLRSFEYYVPHGKTRRRRQKITSAEFAAIKERIRLGDSHAVIAAAFDTSVAMVSRVRNAEVNYGR